MGHETQGFDAFLGTPLLLGARVVFYMSNESSGVVALGDLPPTDDKKPEIRECGLYTGLRRVVVVGNQCESNTQRGV
jgi:hypothetical protein